MAPGAGVGLRSGRGRQGEPSDAPIEKVARAKEAVAEAARSRKQRVWDKLDSARAAADARQQRLRKFGPTRGGSGEPR